MFSLLFCLPLPSRKSKSGKGEGEVKDTPKGPRPISVKEIEKIKNTRKRQVREYERETRKQNRSARHMASMDDHWMM